MRGYTNLCKCIKREKQIIIVRSHVNTINGNLTLNLKDRKVQIIVRCSTGWIRTRAAR